MKYPPAQSGFTLVELIAVIVVLAILAAVAVPRYFDYRDRAIVSAVIRDLKVMASAYRQYYYSQGVWPGNHGTGVLPPGLSLFMDGNIFQRPTPIGGLYDPDGSIFGAGTESFSIIGVTQPSTESLMQQVDQQIDNGDVTTGQLRWTGNRWSYFVTSP